MQLSHADAAAMLKFQIRGDIISLSKSQLNTLDDILDHHEQMIDKLKAALPPQFHIVIDTADYLDQTKFALLRKRCLDTSNDSIRRAEDQIAQFNVNFF